MEEELNGSLEEGDAAVTIEVRGALTRRTGNALHLVLRKVLLDRGRLVVDVSQMRELSDQWGVLRHGDGKTVWALLHTGAVEGSAP